MYAIETHDLTKTFHGTKAVNALNMHVPEGAIYGFLGENGSGKSTTEKMITGLMNPKSGSIKLYGKPHTDPKLRAEIGVLIEAPGCFPKMTVYDDLMMQAYAMNLRNPKQEVERVLKLVRMGGSAGRKFIECSLGMKQRIGLAKALLGRPKLLVLDEPINGLDADGMRIVRETLTYLNQEEGVTILVSSHILSELDKIATHYGIIKRGKLLREIKASQMSEESGDYVAIKTSDDRRAYDLLSGSFETYPQENGGIKLYGVDDNARVTSYLYKNGVTVGEMVNRRISLEEYYTRTITAKEAV